VIAIGCDNKNNTMSFCRRASDGAARSDAFVIGVSVETNES
jgi:hypothetical protein